jgi:hypothetical protein
MSFRLFVGGLPEALQGACQFSKGPQISQFLGKLMEGRLIHLAERWEIWPTFGNG